MNRILVYCETKDGIVDNTAYELISKAYDLKKQAEGLGKNYDVAAICIAANLEEESKNKIYKSGANHLVLIKNDCFKNFSHTICANALADYIKQNPAEILIFPATKKTRSIAPRVTVALDCGLVADCTELELISKDGEIKLAATRPTFGSELMATILSKKYPQCATIRPKTFEIKEVEIKDAMYFEYEAPHYEDKRLKLLRFIPNEENQDIDLSDAKIILAGGFGLIGKNKNEYFEKLQKLADAINASVGITRKAADYGIMSPAYQIGQTGKTVTPQIYIAFGISGAIQHIMGMKNSKKIIAINKDPNAEIFKYADYKIVKDAKAIIDELIENLIPEK